MVIVDRNLSREKIVGHKGHMKWFHEDKENREVLLLINEKQINKYGDIVNIINHKESFGRLCVDSIYYIKDFFEKYKGHKPRVFLRQFTGNLFNEYEVESWSVDEEGLYVKFI